jgi:hypothetical protein
MWRTGRMVLTEKPDMIGGIPILVSHCPQQKPHGLAWDRNQVSAVRVLRRMCEGAAEILQEVGKI